jgi:hypothetical protein
MLMELKQQFDVCDGTGDLAGYRLLILPDEVTLDDALAAKLRAHLEGGGAIVSSGFSGLDERRSAFVLDEYGLTYDGPEPHNPTFVCAGPSIADGVPAMPIAVYTQGIAMRANAETTVLAELHEPYFNEGSWDWRHENVYLPPRGDSGRPAITERGRIAHFSFALFAGYAEDAVVHHRTLLGNCLARLLPDPRVLVAGMPSFGQVTVTTQPKRTMVHLLCYVPELRGKRAEIVEEAVTALDVHLRLRTDDRAVSRVYLAPSEEEIASQNEESYVSVTVPRVSGYQMVVFEHG